MWSLEEVDSASQNTSFKPHPYRLLGNFSLRIDQLNWNR